MEGFSTLPQNTVSANFLSDPDVIENHNCASNRKRLACVLQWRESVLTYHLLLCQARTWS